jgi:hypothetical protein
MITNLIYLIQNFSLYGGGECIEISKGKYEYPQTLKEKLEKVKRIIKSKK